MRHVHVSHTRSRSRSPLLRGPRPLVSKSHPVNMLDKDALLAVRAKKESKPFAPKERITCTIDGPRRSGAISSRNGGYVDKRRIEGDRFGGFLNRQSMRDRLSFSDRQGRDRFEASRERDFDSSRFNGKFRDDDADKPVQRLIDPTAVPKGKSYFGHDDRGEERQWRGRSAYDPRIDMGPRRDRLSGFRGYYGRDRDRYDRRDRDGPRRSFGPKSAADGLWTHDKFIELEGDEGSDYERSTGVEIVVDQSTESARAKRVVHEIAGTFSVCRLHTKRACLVYGAAGLMDEEDDYMSDNFLAMTQNIKPGLATTVEHRRVLKIETDRMRNRQQDTAKPKKRELEKVLREEALSRPMPEDSKGYLLLAKMGYKPGMSLGKRMDGNGLDSGIKEPIQLEVKSTRAGLGHDSERENQSKQRLLREMERMKRRAAQTVELIDDYQKRKRGLSNTKDLIRDILASRSICVELDMRLDIQIPEHSWFWKSYKQPNNEDETTEGRSNSVIAADSEDDSRRYVYANGKEAPEEERFDELDDEELNERLSQITRYLRSTHCYCIWCGCQFERQEELESYCPGLDRHAHDSIDE